MKRDMNIDTLASYERKLEALVASISPEETAAMTKGANTSGMADQTDQNIQSSLIMTKSGGLSARLIQITGYEFAIWYRKKGKLCRKINKDLRTVQATFELPVTT